MYLLGITRRAVMTIAALSETAVNGIPLGAVSTPWLYYNNILVVSTRTMSAGDGHCPFVVRETVFRVQADTDCRRDGGGQKKKNKNGSSSGGDRNRFRCCVIIILRADFSSTATTTTAAGIRRGSGVPTCGTRRSRRCVCCGVRGDRRTVPARPAFARRRPKGAKPDGGQWRARAGVPGHAHPRSLLRGPSRSAVYRRGACRTRSLR